MSLERAVELAQENRRPDPTWKDLPDSERKSCLRKYVETNLLNASIRTKSRPPFKSELIRMCIEEIGKIDDYFTAEKLYSGVYSAGGFTHVYPPVNTFYAVSGSMNEFVRIVTEDAHKNIVNKIRKRMVCLNPLESTIKSIENSTPVAGEIDDPKLYKIGINALLRPLKDSATSLSRLKELMYEYIAESNRNGSPRWGYTRYHYRPINYIFNPIRQKVAKLLKSEGKDDSAEALMESWSVVVPNIRALMSEDNVQKLAKRCNINTSDIEKLEFFATLDYGIFLNAAFFCYDLGGILTNPEAMSQIGKLKHYR